MKRAGTEPFTVYRAKPSLLPVLEIWAKGSSGSAAGWREGCPRTCTGGLCARPGQVGLTHSGRAPLELVASDAGEFTGGPVIIAVAGALHVAILWGVEFAAASDCVGHKPRGGSVLSSPPRSNQGRGGFRSTRKRARGQAWGQA